MIVGGDINSAPGDRPVEVDVDGLRVTIGAEPSPRFPLHAPEPLLPAPTQPPGRETKS